MELNRGAVVRACGVDLVTKDPEPVLLLVFGDRGRPLIAEWGYALEPGLTSDHMAVRVVAREVGSTEVCYTVVVRITVSVINNMIRPNSVVDSPRQMVRSEADLLAVDADVDDDLAFRKAPSDLPCVPTVENLVAVTDTGSRLPV